MNDPASWKIRTRHEFHQLIQTGRGMPKQVDQCINQLAQIMRRNFRSIPRRDPGRTVNQKIGNAGWQDSRLFFGIVKVQRHINRIFVDILEHQTGNLA